MPAAAKAEPNTMPRLRKRAAPNPSAYAFTIPDGQAMGAPSTTTIYKLAKDGKLKLVRVAGRTMIEGDSLRALLRG
jgi:hypothetical protein